MTGTTLAIYLWRRTRRPHQLEKYLTCMCKTWTIIRRCYEPLIHVYSSIKLYCIVICRAALVPVPIITVRIRIPAIYPKPAFPCPRIRLIGSSGTRPSIEGLLVDTPESGEEVGLFTGPDVDHSAERL